MESGHCRAQQSQRLNPAHLVKDDQSIGALEEHDDHLHQPGQSRHDIPGPSEEVAADVQVTDAAHTEGWCTHIPGGKLKRAAHRADTAHNGPQVPHTSLALAQLNTNVTASYVRAVHVEN